MTAGEQQTVLLCGPPKECTCPAVAWSCCCEASDHGRRMIAGLACDCGLCAATNVAGRRWLRPGSSVVHLSHHELATAAFCGVSLHDAVLVASNKRVCGHCARTKAATS